MNGMLRSARVRVGVVAALSVMALSAVFLAPALSSAAAGAGPGASSNGGPCQYMKTAPAPSIDSHIFISPAPPYLKRGAPATGPAPKSAPGTAAAIEVKDCHPTPAFVPMATLQH